MTKIPSLVAVVEVDQDSRVLCQAAGCGHSVYKRIHVVHDDGKFVVLGSECFKRLYGQTIPNAHAPQYGSSDGRKLTQEERNQLAENTAKFIAYLESERVHLEEMHVQQIEIDAAKQRQLDDIRLARIEAAKPKDLYADKKYLPFDGPAGMHYMWVRDFTNANEHIKTYKSGTKQTKEIDFILRSFNATRSDPWAFAQSIKQYSALPPKFTLFVLLEFDLIVLLPAYR